MPGEDAKVYVISVAAELAGMHPQTLRQYDRLGLVTPSRASGRGRRYSLRDIATLREVQRLSQDEGVNLAGIKRILELEAELEQLKRQVEYLRAFVDPGRRIFTADPRGDVVAVNRTASRSRRPTTTADRAAVVLWHPSNR
ncbi:transcriptional regulator [Cellulomonas sp. Root485]|uniref:heat shock protein transcriptional repressor HspR n=1 Tax=Cellulomonas sp. Root485 TaxID=1736546 RepID=UPI0006FD99C6|nr:helix-turn-helix transcriptional regulator [Cellulomonas sp. Root485]KQY21994.1 transcriptional regulator [Cellulomonas sp. Root485]